MKNMHELVRRLNRFDDGNLFSKHGVCTEFVTKLTDYSFITFN